MKRIQLTQLISLLMITISYLSFSCKSIAYDYCKDDDIDLKSKEYLKENLKIDSNEIALILNGEAFDDNKLIIYFKNKIDTVNRYNSNDIHQPTIIKKFRKDEKIKLKHSGNSIKIKIKPEYNYIRVSKFKKEWYVTYCHYPLVYLSF